MNQLEKEVYHYFKKPPIDVMDEEEGIIASTGRWQLSVPRDDGSDKIGMLNLWLATKAISDTSNLEFEDESVVDIMVNICNNLIEYGLLKEDPDYKRQKFTLITNEELNARREERGPYSRPEHD